MFAKREWFKQSACGQGVCPVSSRGWLFLAMAGAAIIVPTIALGAFGKIVPEAIIWLAFSSLVFYGEMRGLRRQVQAERDRNLLFIGGEDKESPEVATRNFDLKLRG